jgi:broad specificity phosphatase PhoE
MKLLLVRHGESEGNAAGALQGRLNFGLSPLGLVQAERTAARLADSGAARVVSSPLLRATATADAIASALGQLTVFDDRLAEYDIGEASGLTGPQIRERYPEVVAARMNGGRMSYPGEEGRDAFEARLRGALSSFQMLEGPTIAVAHGGVISALCHLVVGLDLNRPGIFQAANCSITEIVSDRSGRLVLARHNDTCHLEGIVTTADRG